MLEQIVRKVSCPYCGEIFEALIDCSVPAQEYVEDCWVCCRPINFSVSIDSDGQPDVTTLSENE